MRRRTTIAMLTENRPGVMARIAHLFSRRGFNLLSISAEETDRPDEYCITVVVDEDEATLHQVKKQIKKLIDVAEVSILPAGSTIERKVALVKVDARNGNRERVAEEAKGFAARVVDIGAETITLEIANEPGRVDAFVEALRPYGLREVVRSGAAAVPAGDETCFGNHRLGRENGSGRIRV